ncbi:unnamed protein product, partial [Hapterophycus canaliculatus]
HHSRRHSLSLRSGPRAVGFVLPYGVHRGLSGAVSRALKARRRHGRASWGVGRPVESLFCLTLRREVERRCGFLLCIECCWCAVDVPPPSPISCRCFFVLVFILAHVEGLSLL